MGTFVVIFLTILGFIINANANFNAKLTELQADVAVIKQIIHTHYPNAGRQ